MSPLEIVIFLPIAAALAIWLGAPARPTSLLAALINLVIIGGIAFVLMAAA
jgi:NADH-quinone oxidoreductase subunit M